MTSPSRSARAPLVLATLLAVAAVQALAADSPAPARGPAEPALSATVRIGGEIKRSTGRVKELQNGDVACVMVLADERGREFIESADFEICFQEPSLIGRWVQLSYRMERVIAESCQGDPACAESELIPLVVAAKILAEPGRPSAPPTSHCAALESIVFACDAGSKNISVCASSSLSTGSVYLEYRFGRLGGAPELTLPATRVPPAQAATGENVAFSGGGGAWLRFRNGATAYVVYGGIGRWGPDGATAEKQGVVVEREGRQIAHVPCTGPLDSALSSEWFAEAGVGVGADEEFLFP